jgi:ribosomal protein S18 acetylase RimI-like enzyme
MIRPFDLDRDYEAALRLWRTVGPGVNVSPSDSRDALALKLTRDPDLFLVADDEAGQLIGTVIGGFDGRRGLVYHLAVAAGHRGRGLGTALMAELERRLKAKGCYKYYLLITPDNPSVADFYRRLDWDFMPVQIMGKVIE